MRILMERLRKFADRGWYGPFIGLLAGADQFVVIVPIEGLMISGVFLHPRRWLSFSLWVTTGCALGAVAMAVVASSYGQVFIDQLIPNLTQTSGWARATSLLNTHGAWALALIAASPLPQQPAVAFAGLSHMPPERVFISVWVGRALKYVFLSWAASHAPRLLFRLSRFFELKKHKKENPNNDTPNS